MSRWYKYTCAAIAACLIPGGFVVGGSYLAISGYRAISRRWKRRQLRRIVVAYQGRPWKEGEPWGQA